ncbi:hypothetical protein RIF29_09505 [Crotalaria pallida]|uniref:Uncharacterized protein n=1 Tax=Crotalaria pallida TaxID=3830 RepID=A0AAN9ILM9_CROPI
MAGKRGRPPKTPNSSSKKTPSIVKRPEGSSSKELSLSDEEALEDIDSLTPKKAAELSNVTQKWVEKKKPSREDIEKIDDCLRANDEKVVESAVKQANGENSQPSTSYVEDTPESTASKEGVSVNVQDKGKEKVVECVQEGSDSENTQPWIPFLNRRLKKGGCRRETRILLIFTVLLDLDSIRTESLALLQQRGFAFKISRELWMNL